jgi:hypothetical protein
MQSSGAVGCLLNAVSIKMAAAFWTKESIKGKEKANSK